ncbi:hypothetical protein LCGC14_1121140 [marine sediment metagenome]|uniref:Uncharacterized protein n=1 Tax=marine sediment metagenome TaxID=412755 RepID=A0A0F9PM39_9ZZZZ
MRDSGQEDGARGAVVTVAAPCVHHDIIEMPHGPVSKARCKLCGEEREYDTSLFYEYNVKESLNRPPMTPLDRKFRREWRDD